MPDTNRFWSKVEKSSGCWLWTGPKSDNGYGCIGLRGKTHYAHRVAFQLAYGVDPGDAFVCHTCDVRNCVRPDHLFLGDVAANARDCARKGRTRGGLSRRKLQQEDASAIRSLRKQGWKLKALAEKFATSVEVVSHIVHGRTYNERQPLLSDARRGPVPVVESSEGKELFPLTLEERFWSKVRKTDGCWIWQGGYYRTGYGRFHIARRGVFAHRAAYEFEYAPIPSGMVVMHLCDNPACVRPDHLRLGDQAANVADMVRKQRYIKVSLPGERNGRAKLSEADVREILRLHASGAFTNKQLSATFGVVPSTIAHIVHGRTWKGIGKRR